MRRQPVRAVYGLVKYLSIRTWRKAVVGEEGWSTKDPSLLRGDAPHETRAVMRLHRAGWPGMEVTRLLKIRPTQLMHQLQLSLQEEGAAHREKRVIYDALVKKGTV